MRKLTIILLTLLMTVSTLFTPDVAQASKANTAKNVNQYNTIVEKNLRNLNGKFKVTYVGNSNALRKSLKNTVPNAIKKDPLISGTVKTYSYTSESSRNKIVVEYKMTYYSTKAQERYAKKESKKIAKNIMKKHKTQLDRVKAVNDYVAGKTTYGGRTDARYTTYGVLKNNVAVCQGYAITGYRILKEMKIPVRYVIGHSNNEKHAWLKVSVNKRWYNMDITWNDTSSNSEYKKLYKYFLVSDAQLRKTHTWNNAKLPKANTGKYNFLNKASSVVKKGNTIYYANDNKRQRLYSYNVKTNKHKKVTNTRVQNLVIFKGKLYYSNYSDSGKLARMNTNGKKQQNLNKSFTTDLHVKSNKLVYKTKNKFYARNA